MPTITISNTILMARQKSDMENTSFVTDAEIISKLNSAWQKLYNLIIDTSKTYYLTTYPITLTSATEYSLPVDFWKLLGVDYRDSATAKPRNVWPKQFAERNRRTNYWYDAPMAYILKADKIAIIPNTITPTGFIDVHYAAEPVAITTTSQTLHVPPFGEEWLACRVAIEMLAKEESDASIVGAMKEEAERELIASLRMRDIGAPDSAVDVAASGGDDLWGRY